MQQIYAPPSDLAHSTATWHVDPGWMAALSALSSRTLSWIGVDDECVVLRSQPFKDGPEYRPAEEMLRASPGMLRIDEFPKPWMRRFGFTLVAQDQSFHLTFLPPDGGGRLAPDGSVVRADLDELAFAAARIS